MEHRGMTGALARSKLGPWTGLFTGAVAWFVDQQAGSGGDEWDCHFATPAWILGLAVVCGIVCALGGWTSWRARREAPEGQSAKARQVGGIVGAGAAAVFGLAIGFQTLAGLIVPACFR